MFNGILAFAMSGEFNDACFSGYRYMSLDDINLYTAVCYAI